MNKNIERFIRYAKIDTQADDTTGTTPSTEKQKNLGRLLVKELLELGLEDAYMDEYGIVYAHLDGEGDVIGLNAHMDTALEVTDTGVNPQIVNNWDGNDIKLNDKYKITLEQFPKMKAFIGKDLVVTDGNTLLGADDKAGIAIIMNALQYYKDHSEEKHSTICVCFTVDEEIGEGPLHFNYRKMNAKYAYTIDGSSIDKIECENFNAYSATVNFKGVSIHPGEGKGKLINALNLASEFVSMLPKETPYESEDKEGFYHLTGIEGTCELAKLTMIIRDFKDKGMNKRIDTINEVVKKLNKLYPTANVEVTFKKQYVNMRKYVDKKPMAIRRAKEALKNNGIEPSLGAIRGGTDGATFSKCGLITPNLGTGSYNHHGRYEFLDVQEFDKMISVVIDLVK